MNKKKMIWILIIVILTGLVLKAPINPKYDVIITNREVMFNVFGFANEIKVDDNTEFISPITKNKPFIFNLDPGVYYWKADNSFLIGKFTIQSEVNVKLEKLEEKYRISNLGNTPVDLEITGSSFLTGAVVGLGKSLDLNLMNDSRVIVSQSSIVSKK